MDYIPQPADKFMMQFKNGDRSWQSDVFECVRTEDRFVVAKMIVGWRSRDGKPRVFFRNEVTFFPCSDDLADAIRGEAA